MPAIVAPEDHQVWLDPQGGDVAALETLVLGEPKIPMRTHPVSRRVNNPRNEGPDLGTPATSGQD